MKPPPPVGTAPANLQTARRLVLYMLVGLGACTLFTAGLLVVHTLETPSNALVWISKQQLSSWARAEGAGAGSALAAQAGVAAGLAPAAGGAAAGGPVPKELDPDYVLKAKAALAGKACAPGCTARGNCNAEEGRCECPFGWVGPTCSKPLFPACRMASNATEMHCGDRIARSCECLRQCRAHFCPAGARCETPRDPWFVRCFERVNTSTGAVLSDIPEAWEEGKGRVAWYRGIRADMQREKLLRATATWIREPWRGAGEMVALPAARCPDRCSARGNCVKTKSEEAKCLCWQGYTGAACEQSLRSSCVNQCLGRGLCLGGFCHCSAGYWGKDCSRSKAYAPHNAHSSVTALKVYAYELPTHLAFDMERFVGYQGHDPIYIAYKGFMSGFLHDWSVRTENPWEANLFYVPALTYAYSSNLGDVSEHLRRVMAWVAEAHPFFNRTGGRDHFFWLPSDRGACWIDPADPLLGAAIKVVHFGFHQTNSRLPNDFQLMPAKGAACFKPERDIVAAPYFSQQDALARQTYVERKFSAREVPSGKLLFFAGSIREKEADYSGGVRQELWALAKGGKLGRDVFISDRNDLPDFVSLVRSSKFCLAPWGHGWGNRLGQYMVLGCVPVIVQDGVWQPYQDLLPYHRFSVRLPKARLKHIAEVLASIGDEEYFALRAGVAQFWPAFVWHPAGGGLAYNYTVQSLAARAHGHLAGMY